jgi:hypothetical protein
MIGPQNWRKSALSSNRLCAYTANCAAVVVEARPFLPATELTTLIVIGIILAALMLGFLCWLLFQLAVLALPVFAAVTTGLAMIHSGAECQTASNVDP